MRSELIRGTVKELIWILPGFLLSGLFLFPSRNANGEISFQSYDTYVVFPFLLSQGFVFLNVIIGLYLIRQIWIHFRVLLQNIVLAAAAGVLMLWSSVLLIMFSGWSQPTATAGSEGVVSSVFQINPVVLSYQLFLLIIFAISVFFAGRSVLPPALKQEPSTAHENQKD